MWPLKLYENAGSEIRIDYNYFHDGSKNHAMRLADIIQEAFLLDINSSLLLEADRISYKEDYSLQPLSVIASYVILAIHRTSFQWELEVY